MRGVPRLSGCIPLFKTIHFLYAIADRLLRQSTLNFPDSPFSTAAAATGWNPAATLLERNTQLKSRSEAADENPWHGVMASRLDSEAISAST
jgi:hypothetical protein